jgi:ABC-type xylose transport system permease subunit
MDNVIALQAQIGMAVLFIVSAMTATERPMASTLSAGHGLELNSFSANLSMK